MNKKNIIKEKRTIIGVYDNHLEAVRALKALQKANFPMDKISVIGRDENIKSVEDAHEWQDAIKKGIPIGGTIGLIVGLLAGVSAISIPGVGVVFLGGTVGSAISASLTGTVTGALAGTFVGTILGVEDGIRGTIEGEETSVKRQKLDAEKYRNYLKEGKYLVLIEDSDEETETAHDILVKNEEHPDLEVNKVVYG